MRVSYKEYTDIKNLPVPLANLPWTHNYILIEKVKNIDKKNGMPKKCFDNSWSQTILIHQIDSNLYQRQKENLKLNNFNSKKSIVES